MIEIRCPKCNKLLAKGRAASLEVKCPRCQAIVIVTKDGAAKLRLRPAKN
ncbi:Com family DNA-binding transcriptional regulator [Desulfovibrio sp. OttesenSCG-928-C14]|nr:Com family DNA-binding transcriptional regulator [Desulfovibrio sp. OttesenSCG-928-C14]